MFEIILWYREHPVHPKYRNFKKIFERILKTDIQRAYLLKTLLNQGSKKEFQIPEGANNW